MGKHIALLCMSLNIGGAETHIFELAKGLKAKGNEVTVFSNGGVYAAALEEAGIRHIQAPLHKKSLSALYNSYCILKKEFMKHRPSVVHSHTRISNYVGNLVCKKLDIPLVTTVHFNFRVNFLLKHFSNWGSRALAVSEDLKNYLVENYRYDPDHVSLTVNGIDMNRFCKKDAREFRTSLGIKPDEKMILMVSRLDKEASIHVARFLKIAPDLYKKVPCSRIVIVGNGNCFADFAARAKEINKQCGSEFILLQGAKTNIEQYTAAADLFVGISRSALEAMSSSVPTILLGNLGYLGLYSDEIRSECIETNLTCRGYPYPTDEEICALAADCLTGKDLTENIEAGRRLVQERFSIDTMAETAETMYRDAINNSRPLDYMISGYYGSDNFGDNLTLRCLMEHLNGYSGTVLTHNVQNTQVPEQIHKLHRFDLWQIRKAMKKTKVFLLGSGSLLQDATSNRSLFYYQYVAKMAMRYHCKTLLYANGIGPISREQNKKRTAVLLNKLDFITVRDQESMDLLQELKVTTPAVLTADDSFSVDFSNLTPIPTNAAGDKTIVGINFKLEPNCSEKTINEIVAALKELAERHHLYYYMIPFHLSQDQPQLKVLHEHLPQISSLIEPSAEPQVLMQYVAAGKFHVFERLHGQIMATMLQIPFLPINYDPKNQSLVSQIGMQDYLLHHAKLSKETIIHAFEQILKDQDQIRSNLAEYTASARKAAQLNHRYLQEMIDQY